MTDPYNNLGEMDPNTTPVSVQKPLYGQPGYVAPRPTRWYNAAECVACGEVVESTHQHDFRVHSCQPEIWFAVDGGPEYCRRVWGVEGQTSRPEEHYIDLSHGLP